MSDKISESNWKAFVKKQKLALELDDKDLLKALARFDKIDARKHEAILDALQELSKEIPRQVSALGKLKKQLGDKPFGLLKDELYETLEAVEALRKKTEAAIEAQRAEDDEEDEDSKPNALINPKLLFKQLSMCRKDPERTMKFAFVDGKDKQPAMLALHPRMSGRALFGKLQLAAGVKSGAYGTAWVDGTSLMLQLDKPLSGLVKKLRPVVKACGFKISKAVLWNADGTVFEQDEQAEDALDESATPPLQSAPPQPAATYQAKLAALQPRVQQAAAEGSADATKHQRLLEFAAAKAAGGDYLVAMSALKQIELLLDQPTPKVEGVDPAAGDAFKLRLAALIPGIRDAAAAGDVRAADLKLKASEAGTYASKKDFVQAKGLLDQVEQALETIRKETEARAARRDQIVLLRDAAPEPGLLEAERSRISTAASAFPALAGAISAKNLADAEAALISLQQIKAEIALVRAGRQAQATRIAAALAQAVWGSGALAPPPGAPQALVDAQEQKLAALQAANAAFAQADAPEGWPLQEQGAIATRADAVIGAVKEVTEALAAIKLAVDQVAQAEALTRSQIAATTVHTLSADQQATLIARIPAAKALFADQLQQAAAAAAALAVIATSATTLQRELRALVQRIAAVNLAPPGASAADKKVLAELRKAAAEAIEKVEP